MSTSKKITSVLTGIVMIAFCVVMLLNPDVGCYIVIPLLGLSLLLYGIKLLIYYFTMAIHMVDGKLVLYESLIIIDFGVFTGFMATVPAVYGIIYLVGSVVVSGVLDIMEARESKKMGGHWRLSFYFAALEILSIIPMLIFIDSQRSLVYIYCFMLLHSAIGKIISAFRKTDVVYVCEN